MKTNNVRKIYFSGPTGDTYGWGICNKNLLCSLQKYVNTVYITDQSEEWNKKHLDGILLTPICSHELEPLCGSRGVKTFGYTFFENELTQKSIDNARFYDVIFAGSSWCVQKLKEKNILNSEVLIQGVDHEIFYPINNPSNDSKFIIFSGGKLELRKGQDLVIKAISIFQRKYKDVYLVNSWFNHWDVSISTIKASPHINFVWTGNDYKSRVNKLCETNGLDISRVITMPLLPNKTMADVYRQTDIGLFPNRCEGGTNLVMMEYMACGKPVIATYATGHVDVLNNDGVLRLTKLRNFNVVDQMGSVLARWVEPDVEEILDKLEFAYHNRKLLTEMGSSASNYMKKFTWDVAAQKIINVAERVLG